MSELRTNRIIPRDGLVSGAFGGVIQTVFAENNTANSYSTGNTGAGVSIISATITPTRSDSRVLIMGHTHAAKDNNNDITQEWSLQISRGGTLVGGNTNSTYFPDTNVIASSMNGRENGQHASWHHLDNPSTTSAVTYQILFAGGEGGSYAINRPYGTSNAGYNFKNTGGTVLILMEISG